MIGEIGRALIYELERFPDSLNDYYRDNIARGASIPEGDISIARTAVAEARKLRIPIVAIVDTNCDPETIDYPIAGNDDAIKSIQVIVEAISKTIAQAKGEFIAKTGKVTRAGKVCCKRWNDPRGCSDPCTGRKVHGLSIIHI